MKELINELIAKAGLSEESATKAVDTTLGFIKGKLPPVFGDKIEDLLSGNFDLGSLFGGASNDGVANDSPLDKLKDMFGGKA